MFDWLDELNAEQRAAVLHDGGHLLIVAGAGSGKTRTLACWVARLLADVDGARRVWGRTFHAVANRLLRQHGGAVGASSATSSGWGSRAGASRDTLASIYSRVVNAQETLADVVERAYPWCRHDLDGLKEVFAGYVARKRARNVVDYDDLLLY
jgi:DNA helicase-2/ATP-dependent DNA helicase PcrA